MFSVLVRFRLILFRLFVLTRKISSFLMGLFFRLSFVLYMELGLRIVFWRTWLFGSLGDLTRRLISFGEGGRFFGRKARTRKGLLRIGCS